MRHLVLPLLTATFFGAIPPAGGASTAGVDATVGVDPTGPRYRADGSLLRPSEVERWILVGASLGLGYSDATENGPGMFHRVYLEPTAYDHFQRTGRFREGTMLALAIRRPERRVPPSRAGWSEGSLVALELAVKDSKRFAGGWAYFDFGRSAAAAPALPPGRCARCHAEHAARDNVFLQFYPDLRDRDRGHR
jgi:Cytochrome P460